jgi:Leucine-rich repeat (LRR) protein
MITNMSNNVFDSLVILDLSNNGIVYWSNNNMSMIENLILDRNNFAFIESFLANYPNLSLLSLDYNGIVFISQITNLNLNTLSLNNNQITEFSYSSFSQLK